MLLPIAIGGVVGTLARFGVEGVVHRWAGSAFPWGTLAVNVSGSLLIGFLARLGTGAAAFSPDVRAALLIGFCGAYTTFSSYSYETVSLLEQGAWARAGAYAVGTVVVSLVATMAGMTAADHLL